MIRLAVFSSVLVLCHAAVAPKPIAVLNNNLLAALDLVETNLAHTTEDATNIQKRIFSIIAEATLLYVTKSSDPHVVVRELHELLADPADVIGADTRKDLAYVKSIVAQPINDIKRSCNETTLRAVCLEILGYYVQQQVDKCPEYSNHVSLRNRMEKLIRDKDLEEYVRKSVAASRNINLDISAIAFFLENLPIYEHVFEKIRNAYHELSTKKYPCMLFGAYNSVNNMI